MAAGLDKRSIDVEELQVALAERLFNPDAVEAGRSRGTVEVGDGIFPETRGVVAALGRPDPAGCFAEVPYVGVDGGPDLGADALIGAEERQEAVSRGGGDDTDQAGIVEVAKRLNEIAAQMPEVLERLREEPVPEAGNLGEVMFSALDEECLVFPGGYDLAREVVGKFGGKDGMSELLEQDGRKVEVAMEADVIAFQIFENAQEGQVGLGCGFVQPLHPMRPCAVVYDIWQMRVQGEREKASWATLWMGGHHRLQNDHLVDLC